VTLEPITEVEVWTDGAHSKGLGGWACIFNHPENSFFYLELSGGAYKTTSQRMEIQALIEALKYIENNAQHWVPHLVVHTDSSYLKNCFTNKWYKTWLANGWKNNRGDPVANRDLWEELLGLYRRHTIRFVKVKGHRGIELNERCDELAVAQRVALIGSQPNL
jgi:ribonuclease HI